MYVYVYMCICMYICMYICIYIYIYIYIIFYAYVWLGRYPPGVWISKAPTDSFYRKKTYLSAKFINLIRIGKCGPKTSTQRKRIQCPVCMIYVQCIKDKMKE